VDILKALCGVSTLVTNVNLPNAGQICNLPLGNVVETNAVLCGSGIFPVEAGPMPDELQAMTMPFTLNQNLVVEAALQKDRELAFRSFLNDPMVRRLRAADARALFDEMDAALAGFMPWNLNR
ncbi:MAG: alpha-glucosidase/alpha-galactosidase, partial [Butyricicoccus sp.]